MTKFVSGIMGNIINRQRQKNIKALENDPKLKAMEAELAKSIEKFKKSVESYTGGSSAAFRKKYGL